jgi:chaperonin GroES
MSRPMNFTQEAVGSKEVKPLSDYLVLRPLTKPGMVGLIHLPDCDSIDMKNGTLCEIVSTGPGRLTAQGVRIPMEVKVGETVHLTAYGTHSAGAEIVVAGEKLIMIRQRDINGVIEKVA